jgi:predicted O-methyltransferase YrrM
MHIVGTYQHSVRVAFPLPPTVRHWRYHILAHLIQTKHYHTVVEIGTFEGETAEYVLQHCPGIVMWCVDPYIEYPAYTGITMAQSLAKAEARVFTKFNNVHHLHCTSVQAAAHFKPEAVDIVFIDGNHLYDAVKLDLVTWYPIVAKGGILCGHDYKEYKDVGVIRAVDEFCVAQGITTLKSSSDAFWFIEK